MNVELHRLLTPRNAFSIRNAEIHIISTKPYHAPTSDYFQNAISGVLLRSHD